MTRAKTKVGESLEYIRGDGERRRWIGPPGSTIKDDRRTLRAAISTGVIHTGEGRVDMRGARVIRVTRVRLAPLVELPAWAPGRDNDDEPGTCWETGQPGFIAAAHYEHDGAWIAHVADFETANEVRTRERIFFSTEHPTADEARAACEARLRELGYRVARKGGAA